MWAGTGDLFRGRKDEGECKKGNGNGNGRDATGRWVGRWVRVRDERTRGSDIALRLIRLSVAVIRLVDRLTTTVWGRHVGLQVVRASTSAGANYQEARHAESRADFVHKVGIAAKELAESLYWLRLVAELDLFPDQLPDLLRETDELIAILVASARTARAQL